jgi:hypothetical protein
MTKARFKTRAVLASLLTAGLLAPPAQAQPGDAARVDVDADPIRCWWRADRGAIQIGEPVSVTLTCAIVETDVARVVVDRSRLDPSVLTMPPFDVTGGTQPADTVTGSRRFFQYTYVLSVIHENAIGRDLIVPELAISYRIESRTSGESTLEGRDRTYQLPPLPLRLVSLVATDAPDIREAALGGFEAIEARELRGRLLRTAAVVCFVLAALLAIAAVRRTFAGGQETSERSARLTDRAVIRSAGEVLAGARQALQQDATDQTAMGRALDALRVIAAYAVGRTPNQAVATGTTDEERGQLRLHGGWLGGRYALVSASTTAATVTQHIATLPAGAADRRLKLEALAEALSRLTASRYGASALREWPALDGTLGLVASLADDLAREHLWVAQQRRAAMASLSALGARVWTR